MELVSLILDWMRVALFIGATAALGLAGVWFALKVVDKVRAALWERRRAKDALRMETYRLVVIAMDRPRDPYMEKVREEIRDIERMLGEVEG